MCCSRSADSWIGVSGFLISCARRRATSLQAAERCAETTSVMSSKTISRASLRQGGAAHQQHLRVALGRACSSKASCQWSRSPASGLVACSSKRCHTRLRELAQLGHLVAAAGRGTPTAAARRMRVAPGLTVSMRPSRSNTITPAVRLSRMVCSRVRAPSSCVTPRCTCLARVGQLRRHVGEGARQPAELVARGEHRLAAQVAGGHLAHAVGQQQQRAHQLVAQQRRQQHRAEDRQHQRQRQRADVHAAQAAARQRALLVLAVGRLHRQRIGRQLPRHRLHRQQEAVLAGLERDLGVAAPAPARARARRGARRRPAARRPGPRSGWPRAARAPGAAPRRWGARAPWRRRRRRR